MLPETDMLIHMHMIWVCDNSLIANSFEYVTEEMMSIEEAYCCESVPFTFTQCVCMHVSLLLCLVANRILYFFAQLFCLVQIHCKN